MKNYKLLVLFFLIFTSRIFAQGILLTPGKFVSNSNSGAESLKLFGVNNQNIIEGIGIGGTLTTPTATLSGTNLLSINGSGYTGNNFTNGRVGIQFLSTENWGFGNTGTKISFLTTKIGTGITTEKMVINGDGNVGIGDATPTTKLSVNGDISVKTKTISTLGSIVALDRESSSVLYFNGSGVLNLRGIAGGQDGLILYIYNAGQTTLNIINEDIGAASANRIYTHTGTTVTIIGRGGCTMIYDAVNSKWRIIGMAQ